MVETSASKNNNDITGRDDRQVSSGKSPIATVGRAATASSSISVQGTCLLSGPGIDDIVISRAVADCNDDYEKEKPNYRLSSDNDDIIPGHDYRQVSSGKSPIATVGRAATASSSISEQGTLLSSGPGIDDTETFRSDRKQARSTSSSTKTSAIQIYSDSCSSSSSGSSSFSRKSSSPPKKKKCRQNIIVSTTRTVDAIFNTKNSRNEEVVKVKSVISGQDDTVIITSRSTVPHVSKTTQEEENHDVSNLKNHNVRNRGSGRKVSRNTRSSKNKNSLSRYRLHNESKQNIFNRIIISLVSNIENCILNDSKQISNPSFFNTYDPIPLLIISSKVVDKYITFDNVIILSNPQIETKTRKNSFNVHYDSTPNHIGINLRSYSQTQYNDGVDIVVIPRKKVAILVKRNEFCTNVLSKSSKFFIELKLPDSGIRECDNSEFINDYVLISFASFEKDKSIKKESCWNMDFVTRLKKEMTVNMRGVSVANKTKSLKHHGCRGKYYGFGLIAKYNIRFNLSIYEFAGNHEENKIELKNIVNTLRNDIEFIMKRNLRALPFGIYLGYSIMFAYVNIIKKHQSLCLELNNLLRLNGIEDNGIMTSNWVCENAETMNFHQETDGSYTLLSVPFWDMNDLRSKNITLGNANFVFKWTSSNVEQSEQRYLPIKMSSGVSIYFSGFGCYHRQHRTDTEMFWNIGSYQNRSFFQNLKKSIIRCMYDSSNGKQK